jgi:hypothetical protein
MNLLVLHHTYAHGLAFDASNHRNHGDPKGATPGGGPFAGSYFFDGGPARIDVAASPSLDQLTAIRTTVRFRHEPPVPGTRRANLIEAYGSFALFVQPDGSLMGTIVDANGSWRGVTSPPGLVTQDDWHLAEFRHDGVESCALRLDEALVAQAAGVPGPVRGVGTPYGLAIGHWPDPPNVYTFEGHIAEVRLWKYDPAVEIRGLLDPCCTDRAALDELVRRLSEERWDWERLQELADSLVGIGRQVSQRLGAGDLEAADEVRNGGTQAMTAFLRGDGDGFAAAWTRLADLAQSRLTEEERAGLQDRVNELIARAPLEADEVVDLARRLCWTHALAPEDAERRR